jgi:hypothetical protein
MQATFNPFNEHYLLTKIDRLGHHDAFDRSSGVA